MRTPGRRIRATATRIRPRPLASTLAAVVIAAIPAAAGAGSFFVEGRAATGLTGHSDDGDASAREILGDAHAFTLLAPSAGYERITPRAAHSARYTLSTRLNLLDSGGNSVSNRADWASRFARSPDESLEVGASAHQGHTSAYDLAFPRVIEPLPAGGIHFVRADAHQSYGRALGRSWRAGQRARAAVYYPFRGDFNVDHSWEAGGGFDLERQFRYESVALSATARYVSIARPALPGGPDEGGALAETDRNVVAGALVRGSRALSRSVTAELGAGVAGVAHVESIAEPIVRPSAHAALTYDVAAGAAALAYQYDIDTRLNVGETQAMHLARLSGIVPVRRLEGVWLAGAAGFRSGAILDTRAGERVGRSRVFLLDGQIAWEFRRGFTTAVGVQAYQHDDRRDAAPVPARQRSRGQFMISIAGRLPAETPGEAAPPGVRPDAPIAPPAPD